MSDEKDLDNLSPGIAIERKKIDLRPNAFVVHDSHVFRIVEILDFDTVVGVDVGSGRSKALRIGELAVYNDAEEELRAISARDLEEIADEDWRIAESRYAAIKPLLKNGFGRAAIVERSKQVGVNTATLYRWINRLPMLKTFIFANN